MNSTDGDAKQTRFCKSWRALDELLAGSLRKQETKRAAGKVAVRIIDLAGLLISVLVLAALYRLDLML